MRSVSPWPPRQVAPSSLDGKTASAPYPTLIDSLPPLSHMTALLFCCTGTFRPALDASAILRIEIPRGWARQTGPILFFHLCP